MRRSVVVMVAMLSTLASEATPIYPPGAQALEARLLAKMGPRVRTWIAAEARQEVTMNDYSQDAQTQAALRFGAPPADFEALSFLILMQAARDADDDVNNAVDARNSTVIEVARQQQLAQATNNYNVHSELSPGTDIAAQEQAPMLLSQTMPTQDPATAGTTHPNNVAPPPPPKPVDMQRVMDRESDIEDTLAQAAKLVTPAMEAAVQPMS
jgi:hypothetical protein